MKLFEARVAGLEVKLPSDIQRALDQYAAVLVTPCDQEIRLTREQAQFLAGVLNILAAS